MKNFFSFCIAFVLMQTIHAQELDARLSIISSKIGTQVDQKIFRTLQTGLTNFINNRKWTNSTFQPQEKIKCSFLITIDDYSASNNVFKSTLTIQAARPIYNSTYESPIVNFQDPNFQFKYIEFQPIDFNENRVQGSDPLAANITAMIAYYVNLILG